MDNSDRPSVLVGFTGVYLVIYTLLTLFTVYRVVTKDREKCFLTELIHELNTSKKIYFGLAFHVLDQASDYEACAEYFREWQSGRKDELNLDPRWWFFMSVTVLLIHRLISTAVIWHNTRNPRNTVLQLLDLAMVPAVYDGILHGYDKPGNVQRILQSIEAIFESFPQIVLALVFVLRTLNPAPVIALQVLFSGITLGLRICNEDAHHFPLDQFEKAKFNLCKCPPINPFWFARVFFFRIPEILSRVGTISLTWFLIGWQSCFAMVIAEFILCKFISYELSSKIKPTINLDFNWKSIGFYAYLLYFKPGYDHPYVMLYVRPLLSFLFWCIDFSIAFFIFPHRLSLFTDIFGAMRTIFMLCCIISPQLFRCVITNSSEQTIPDYLKDKPDGRDIHNVIQNQQWDKASEMIRVGTDKLFVLSLIPVKWLLRLIDDHSTDQLIHQLFSKEENNNWFGMESETLEIGLLLEGNKRLGLEESVQFVRVVRGLLDRQDSSADVLSEVFSLAKHTGGKDDASGAVSVIDGVMDGLMREKGLYQNTDEDGSPLLITLITRYGRNQDPFDLLIAKYLFIHSSQDECAVTSGYHSFNALHTCAEDYHLTEVLRWLLKNGRIDPNMGDDWNRTPLFIAVIRRNEEGMRVLLENDKVDADEANRDGTTPLMIAVKNGYVSIVRQLVQHGCQKSISDEDGKTALDYGHEYNQLEIVGILDDPNAEELAPDLVILSMSEDEEINHTERNEHVRSNSSSSASFSHTSTYIESML